MILKPFSLLSVKRWNEDLWKICQPWICV